ncbi:hypothetical protein [Muriicola sp. Z0-33]|uniref:hypothetical protein n=1 Tax=Muriicola sp. Z0-33 TaxID=2816957 RepID=UPI002237F668|nr:hypothetical protein [Muriicola sp. Z0-33]MCW5515685.1 hypothetical protein [Muriicola sp. Z0-33]
MKPLYHILIFIFFLGGLSNSIYSQTSQDNKKPVDIFKSTERDSLQIWFYNRATVMGLKGEERDEFYNIILYHTFKMTSLEKKDKGYTPIQVRSKFEELLQKQHSEIKAILDEKQYSYYLDTYNKLLKGVYERKAWK